MPERRRNQRLATAAALAVAVGLGAVGVGADPVLKAFEPGTPIVASEVNANFAALAEAVAENAGGLGRLRASSLVRVDTVNEVGAGLIGSFALTAECPAGFQATGGGAWVGFLEAGAVSFLTSRPAADLQGWEAGVLWTVPRTAEQNRNVHVYAVCVEML